MLAFVTSLAHDERVVDPSSRDALLGQLCDSLRAQTDDGFVLIVVGHRPPAFPLPEFVEFISVDFPPPPAQSTRFERRSDKGAKIGIGLVRARQLDANYVMVADYDDLVHRDLVAFVHANSGLPGWVLTRGLMYSTVRNVFRKIRRFQQRCGTSHILALDLFRVPDGLTLNATPDEVIESFGERFQRLLANHQGIPQYFARQNMQLSAITWNAAIYRLDNGFNSSPNTVRGLVWPMSRKRAQQYGFEPNLGLVRSTLNALAPLPIVLGLLIPAGLRLRWLVRKVMGVPVQPDRFGLKI